MLGDGDHEEDASVVAGIHTHIFTSYTLSSFHLMIITNQQYFINIMLTKQFKESSNEYYIIYISLLLLF